MRKSTVYTGLYGFISLFPVFRVSGTVFQPVEWAVAEKTVNLIRSLVAGIILAVPVFKISVRKVHNLPLSFILKIHALFYKILCKRRIRGVIKVWKSDEHIVIFDNALILLPADRFGNNARVPVSFAVVIVEFMSFYRSSFA